MSTNAKASKIQFQISDNASTPAYTTLAEVVGMPNIAMEMGQADATNMGSPTIGGSIQEEYIATKVMRMDDITLEMNAVLDDTTQIAQFVTAFYQGTKGGYRCVFPEHSRHVTFSAFIKRVEINGDIDNKSNLTATFRPSAGGTWADVA